jgi:hypothetical protein
LKISLQLKRVLFELHNIKRIFIKFRDTFTATFSAFRFIWSFFLLHPTCIQMKHLESLSFLFITLHNLRKGAANCCLFQQRTLDLQFSTIVFLFGAWFGPSLVRMAAAWSQMPPSTGGMLSHESTAHTHSCRAKNQSPLLCRRLRPFLLPLLQQGHVLEEGIKNISLLYITAILTTHLAHFHLLPAMPSTFMSK